MSENTQKKYITNILKIYKGINYNNKDLLGLKNFDNVKNFIETLGTDNTKKSYYISIVSLLKKNGNKDFNLVINKYNKEMLEYKKTVNEERGNNYKTETDIENISFYKLLKKKTMKYKPFSNIEEQIKKTKMENRKRKEEIIENRNELILKLLTHSAITPRNDYQTITIIKDNNFDCKNYDEGNKIVITPNKVYLVLTDFKNVEKIGIQCIEYEKKLYKDFNNFYNFMLKEYPEEKEYELFFQLKDNNNYSSPSISNGVFSHFLKDLIGMTMNDIRHIKITEIMKSAKYKKMTNNQKKKEHLKYFHSMNTAAEYNLV